MLSVSLNSPEEFFTEAPPEPPMELLCATPPKRRVRKGTHSIPCPAVLRSVTFSVFHEIELDTSQGQTSHAPFRASTELDTVRV